MGEGWEERGNKSGTKGYTGCNTGSLMSEDVEISKVISTVRLKEHSMREPFVVWLK